jgi:uncharacterized membrane protein
MVRIEKSIDVHSPLRAVYRQWTRFEEFPQFMAGMLDVEQVDDTHVRAHAEIGGEEQELDAEIVESVPNEYISWKSRLAGVSAAGIVQFEPLGPDATRVQLVVAYEPADAADETDVKMLEARVQDTVEDFKLFIESDGA